MKMRVGRRRPLVHGRIAPRDDDFLDQTHVTQARKATIHRRYAHRGKALVGLDVELVRRAVVARHLLANEGVDARVIRGQACRLRGVLLRDRLGKTHVATGLTAEALDASIPM